ncbi:hypothetical protein OG948_15590 [Embleya sp. NBC_00888]|uniref:SCO2583/SCO2584 N-terminal domain-containing protein n=1 Tax=Embleya sp. NBC_00888 TaxID=2975960 RepID=UPI00386A37F5|nr:hypothetical protein OG948_15590 [Embleya sp. NBC_00888]
MSEHRGDRDAGDGRDRTDGQSGDASGGAAANDPFEGYVFDENFVKGATRVEGSARARMLARKWAEEPPEHVPWRADGPKRRGGRRPLRTILVLAAVLAAVGFAAAPDRVYGWFSGSNTATADDPMVQPPVTGIATSVPSTAADRRNADPNRPTRTNPFAGSPAVNYADNEAGLTLPEVKSVPGYSAAEVTEALEVTRRLLIAGNLDRDVLAGGRPTTFLGLLDPADGVAARIENAVSTNRWDGDNARSWLTRFDPKDVELVGRVVKVNGVMTYDTDREGTLTVHADFSFVYPVAKTGSGSGASVTRSVVRRMMETKVYRAPYQATVRGRVALGNVDADIANSSCTRLDSFVRPEFEDDPQGPSHAPATIDPYDRSKPIDANTEPGACPAVSRV